MHGDRGPESKSNFRRVVVAFAVMASTMSAEVAAYVGGLDPLRIAEFSLAALCAAVVVILTQTSLKKSPLGIILVKFTSDQW
jgi:hypothetical protein